MPKEHIYEYNQINVFNDNKLFFISKFPKTLYIYSLYIMMLKYIFVTVYCNIIWHDNNVRVYGFKNVIHFIFFAFVVHYS